MCHVVCDDKNSLLIGTENVQTVANLPHSINYDVSLGYKVVRYGVAYIQVVPVTAVETVVMSSF